MCVVVKGQLPSPLLLLLHKLLYSPRHSVPACSHTHSAQCSTQQQQQQPQLPDPMLQQMHEDVFGTVTAAAAVTAGLSPLTAAAIKDPLGLFVTTTCDQRPQLFVSDIFKLATGKMIKRRRATCGVS